MERTELLAHVKHLGREFSRRGMYAHLRKLRLYWLALRRGLASPGNDVEVKWTEALVLDWMRTLRIPPFDRDYPLRPRGSACPGCPAPDGLQSAVFTAATFPGGTRMRCQRCGKAWLELE